MARKHGLEFLYSVINHIDDPVFVKDEEYIFVLINDALAKLIGVPRDEIIGCSDYDFFEKEICDMYRLRDDEVFSTGEVNISLEPMVGKNGVEKVIKTKKACLKIDDQKFLVGVISDITKETKLTNQLKNSQANAVVANKAKSNFLANMSHEIRTPIHSIVSFTNLLLEEEKDPNKKEMLSAIKTSGDLLGKIIDNVLDISKVEFGREQLQEEKISISTIIQEVVDTISPLVVDNQNRFTFNLDKRISKSHLGDSVKIRQVLINLLTNATKFTQRGEIRLDINFIKSKENGNEALEFEVTDTGIGIEEKFIPNLYDQFSQESSTRTKIKQGSGLGLAIVKSYVDLMGGKINIKSALGKGTVVRFSIDLKVVSSNIKPVNPLSVDFGSLGSLKILIAEDNELNQMLIRKVLSFPNLELTIVENGLLAVNKAKEINFDAVVLDIHMPIMDGIEACRQIKEIDGYEETLLVALTADVTNELKEEVHELGMVFCGKPLKVEILYNALTKKEKAIHK